jgi:3-O-alpha-D-mannopyranosyl-alpha-D-mannopyranose xylosylphosphotransferase
MCREQDELRHSMRSVLDSLPGHIRSFHLIVADYPFEPEDLALLPNETIFKLDGKKGQNEEISTQFADRLTSHWRVAQTPTWLDFSRRDPAAPNHPYHGHYPTLRYAGHSEVFHLPTMDRHAVTEALGEREWKEREWRKQALPSFNSMAIESRVGWLQGLADVTLSLNDDFFLLKPHAVADFHSPLYGSVIRFDHGYLQQVRPILDKTRFNDAGEVGGLYHANYILSQRYPRRLRPYFAHVPKVITRGLHHEASLMFKEKLTESSRRRFREMATGEGDIQMQWLLTSLRVSRRVMTLMIGRTLA